MKIFYITTLLLVGIDSNFKTQIIDLVILILDETMKRIEYSTYGGGSKQRIMDPGALYVKGGKLLVSSMCISPDFPVTIKYTESDSTWTNCIWKFDLNEK